MDKNYCSACGTKMNIFNKPVFGAGKLHDGGRLCYSCFKTMSEYDFNFPMSSKKKYSTEMVQEILGIEIEYLYDENIATHEKREDSINEFQIPEKIDFFALDLETANENYRSICQIGLVAFSNNSEIYNWSALINPEEDYTNTFIHGIDAKDTKKSPKFPELYTSVISKLENYIVVHHTSFDKTSLSHACQKYSFEIPNIKFIDSSRIARHTWANISQKGYGLDDLAARLNISFNHHDALEDARVAGLITLQALNDSETSIEYWVEEVSNTIKKDQPFKPISQKAKMILRSKSALSAKEIDSLSDAEAWDIIYLKKKSDTRAKVQNQICFTGFTISEKEYLVELANRLGFNVVSSVTKNLTFLCIGDTPGPSKLQKAKDQKAIILTVDDFDKLLTTGELPK
ncbi:MAG: 3'-5' exoribonuclease [Tissierellales bacterium]|nr:3'-5' exoribonuclease [Tissierellales bacterium]